MSDSLRQVIDDLNAISERMDWNVSYFDCVESALNYGGTDGKKERDGMAVVIHDATDCYRENMERLEGVIERLRAMAELSALTD